MSSYTHFTRIERIKLGELKKKGKSIREIARELGRSPSSVSRELRRNQNKNGSYHYWRATILYILRRRNCHPASRLAEGTEIRSYVEAGLSKFWPPETIAACWNKAHPEDRISHTTIYRWLAKGKLKGFSRKKHLRRRGKRIQTRNANYNTIHPDRLIDTWPEDIRTRSRIGDWEGDTVYGGIGKGFIATMVDRRSRFLASARVLTRRPDETACAIYKALDGLPVKSISLDNGSEFSLFRQMEEHFQAPVYFAKPHAPWQRGSNENTNGLLRFFFPKGFDFQKLSDEELLAVIDLLNNRPRKSLGWKTPAEVFFEGVALD